MMVVKTLAELQTWQEANPGVKPMLLMDTTEPCFYLFPPGSYQLLMVGDIQWEHMKGWDLQKFQDNVKTAVDASTSVKLDDKQPSEAAKAHLSELSWPIYRLMYSSGAGYSIRCKDEATANVIARGLSQATYSLTELRDGQYVPAGMFCYLVIHTMGKDPQSAVLLAADEPSLLRNLEGLAWKVSATSSLGYLMTKMSDDDLPD